MESIVATVLKAPVNPADTAELAILFATAALTLYIGFLKAFAQHSLIVPVEHSSNSLLQHQKFPLPPLQRICCVPGVVLLPPPQVLLTVQHRLIASLSVLNFFQNYRVLLRNDWAGPEIGYWRCIDVRAHIAVKSKVWRYQGEATRRASIQNVRVEESRLCAIIRHSQW